MIWIENRSFRGSDCQGAGFGRNDNNSSTLLFLIVIMFADIRVFSIDTSALTGRTASAEAGKFFYVLKKLERQATPIGLGFFPGALVPGQMPRARLISCQDAFVFVGDPTRTGLSIGVALALIAVVLPSLRKPRNVAWMEKDPRRRAHAQIA